MTEQSLSLRARVLAIGLCLASASVAHAAEPALVSPWATEQTARARIVAGGVAGAGGQRQLYAGLEIALADGWKTYWRNPGSSGVPPRFEVSGSDNVASAELLFPAPVRFADRDGDTIGYKGHVVLPVRLTPVDPAKPISLKVTAEFGICRDVCIPVQPTLELMLPPDAATQAAGAALDTAVKRVPRIGLAASGDPQIRNVKVELAGPKPGVAIEASFPGDAAKGDIFVEAPDGIWIPLPKPVGEATGQVREFAIDLTDGADLADLKGKTIRVTLVGSIGAAESSFKLE
ncbi:MAG: protein-disulfide reductase DsbD family protein [Hyphomicrobiaceae bacterium]|nr:protein-disulfide reductase DsbD family protein [Hyphomicrobiaceae bacterium]